MELTIALSVPENSEDYDILDTLESLPWSEDGVDLIVYSKNTERVKRVITSGDLEGVIRDGRMNVLFCETPEEEDTHHTIGLEDTKTEGVMFLKAGDVIEDFQGDLLTTGVSEPIGIPGLGKEGIPETVVCHESRILPESYRGMIFKAQWLRDEGLTQIDLGMTARVCDRLRKRISSLDYWGGWSDYDISESLSVSRVKDSPAVTIPVLCDFWNTTGHSYSPYIKDLVWGRIMTSAADLVPDSNFKKYLYPAGKTVVLN